MRRSVPVRFLLVLFVAFATPLLAKDLVNVDSSGLALQGWDPVSFFDGKPVGGKVDLTASHAGATYRFASEANRERFRKAPATFVPAFGGFCAMGVTYGGTYPVDVSTWQILEGRLVLNKNAAVREIFDGEPAGNLRKADGKWPEVRERKGR